MRFTSFGIVGLLVVTAGCQRMDRAIAIPEASISGRAVRAENPTTPVPFARVGFGARFTLADANGDFLLRDVPRGRYDLDFRSLGNEEPNKRTATRALAVGQGPRDRAEFVLMGSVPLVGEGQLNGVVSAVNPNGGPAVTVRSLSPTAVVRIFTTSPCLSCDPADGVVRGVVGQADALVDGAFALDAPREPITVQAVAYVPSPDPRPRSQLVNDDVVVVLGDTIVGVSNTVIVTDLSAPITLLFDRIDVADEPTPQTGEVTIQFNGIVPIGARIVGRRPAEPAACDITVANERVVNMNTAGTTLTIADVPVGLWRFIECTGNSGATEPVMVTPAGVRVLLQLVGPSCTSADGNRNDCDGDRVLGLLPGELGACEQSCEEADDRCEVGDVAYDCEDDGDGLVDAGEQSCYGSEFGSDSDGDGRCDSVDAYPFCVEDTRFDCEDVVPGEGEGEEGAGEGEGGEGEGGEGEGGEEGEGEGEEGEGEEGEGEEGEGEPPLVLCTEAEIATKYEVLNDPNNIHALPAPVMAIEQRRPFERQLVIMATDRSILFSALVRGEQATLVPELWTDLVQPPDAFVFERGAKTFVSYTDKDGLQRALLFHSGSGTLLVPIDGDPVTLNIAAPSRNAHDLLVLAGNTFAVGGERDGILEASIDRIYPSVGTNVETLQQPRRGQVAITMPTSNGGVDVGYVIGGVDAGNRLITVEALSMATTDNGPTRSSAPSLRVARGYAKAVLLTDGRVVVVGGDVDGRTWEIWDPLGVDSAGPFLLLAPRISGHVAVERSMGGVLVAGGGGTNVAEVLNVTTGCTSPTTTLAPRVGGVAFTTQAGVVFLVGGTDGAGANARVERLDFKPQEVSAPGCSRAVSANDGGWLFLRCADPSVLVSGVNTPTRDSNITDIVLMDLGTNRNHCLSCANNLAQGAGLAHEDVATDGNAVAFTSRGDFSNVLMGPALESGFTYAYVAYAEDAVAEYRFLSVVSTNSDAIATGAVEGPVGLVGDGSQLYVAHGVERDLDGIRTVVSVSNVQRTDPVLGVAPLAFGSDSVNQSALLPTLPLSVGLTFENGIVPVVAFTATSANGVFPAWYADQPEDIQRTQVLANLGQLGSLGRCVRMHTSSDGLAAVCTMDTGRIILMKVGEGTSAIETTTNCIDSACPAAEVEQRFDEGFALVPIVVFENAGGDTTISAPVRRLANGGEVPIATAIVPGGAPSLNQQGTIVTTILAGTVLRYAIDEHVSALLPP